MDSVEFLFTNNAAQRLWRMAWSGGHGFESWRRELTLKLIYSHFIICVIYRQLSPVKLFMNAIPLFI